jgi:hypothetical protein
MTHQSAPAYMPTSGDAGFKAAQLRHVLGLVEQIAGRGPGDEDGGQALDRSARNSAAYDAALPIVQRRFDALALETSTWAAAGVEALLAGGGDPPRAAAARLADELSRALARLESILSL